MKNHGATIGLFCLSAMLLVGGVADAQLCEAVLLDINEGVAAIAFAVPLLSLDTDSDLNADGISDYAHLKHAEAAAADINAPGHDGLLDCVGGDGLELSLEAQETIVAGLGLVADPSCDAECLDSLAELTVTLATID